jgi:hypothetical protein
MDLNGFWLNQLCLTVTTACSLSRERSLTPHHHADGSLKNKKVLKRPVPVAIHGIYNAKGIEKLLICKC